MSAPQKTTDVTAQLRRAKRSATRYGFSYSSFRNLIAAGEIPFIRVGRAYYVDDRDVEKWIDLKKERRCA